MNQTDLQQTPTHTAVAALARLSPPHGYRFEGDSIHLQAKFTVLDDAAYRLQWALQLWACSACPASPRDLTGQIVAEVALPPMREIADEIEHLDMSAVSRPPAGHAEYCMALVLAAGRPGNFDEIHDVATYPRAQSFLQPRMRGNVGYRIDGSRVRLWAEHIENPRDNANCSGTLALELWALAGPYSGGSFEGVPLAGVAIGSISGQTESAATSFELPFSPPPPGNWHFVLMLREWTAAGYLTRDFTNFINPVIYAPIPAAAPARAESTPGVQVLLTTPTLPTRATPAGPPANGALSSLTKAAPGSTGTLASRGQRRMPIMLPAVPAASAATSVSVNTAPEEELAAVEGLSPKLARAIVKKRPFASLDDLQQVKGITLKLLNRIRSRLGL